MIPFSPLANNDVAAATIKANNNRTKSAKRLVPFLQPHVEKKTKKKPLKQSLTSKKLPSITQLFNDSPSFSTASNNSICNNGDIVSVYANFDRHDPKNIVDLAFAHLEASSKKGVSSLLESVGLSKIASIDDTANRRTADFILNVLPFDKSVIIACEKMFLAIGHMSSSDVSCGTMFVDIRLVASSDKIYGAAGSVKTTTSPPDQATTTICVPLPIKLSGKINPQRTTSLIVNFVDVMTYYAVRACVGRIRNLSPSFKIVLCLRLDSISNATMRQAIENLYENGETVYSLGVLYFDSIDAVFIS